MIQGKRVLAVIPVKGKSPKTFSKHLRKVAGQSLLGWTIQTAQESRYIDQLILSSDDLLIIQEAKNYGCDVPFLRPKHLGNQNVSFILPILHAIDCLPGYDLIVVLQPSSPLRLAEDIDNCIQACVNGDGMACISITQPCYGGGYTFRLSPTNQLLLDGGVASHVQHQLDAPCYVPNCAIKVADIPWFKMNKRFLSPETIGYFMPRERSIDVESEFDLWVVKAYIDYLAKRKADEPVLEVIE